MSAPRWNATPIADLRRKDIEFILEQLECDKVLCATTKRAEDRFQKLIDTFKEALKT